MGSLGALGIGLSVVFLGFVLVLVGELYYLVCWKKRRNVAHRIVNQSGHLQQQASLLRAHSAEQQHHEERDGIGMGIGDDDLEQELREVSVIANRHQSFQGELASTKLFPAGDFLMGPPRFLFTIREETKEEIESETVLRSRGGSVDLAARVQQGLEAAPSGGTPSPGCTPFVTPPSSPSLFSTPPATPSPSPSPSPLTREPPMHCAIFIPSPQGAKMRRLPATSAPRTTMMMLLLNTSPPGTPPPTPPGPAAYRTPPTHLYSPRIF